MDINSPVSSIPLIGPNYKHRLEKLGISTVGDLLHHIPARYEDYSLILPVKNARIGDTVTIQGEITFFKNQYTKSGKQIQIAKIADTSGELTLTWFNQPFLQQAIHPGDKLSVSGKVDWYIREKAMVSPQYEVMYPGRALQHTGRIVPVYPETAGISSKWLRSRIAKAYDLLHVRTVLTCTPLDEFLPKDLLATLNLCRFDFAIETVHFPKNLKDAEEGKRRLAFNELLLLQIANLKRRIRWQKNHSTYQLTRLDSRSSSTCLDLAKQARGGQLTTFTSSLPFTLTSSQTRTTAEILKDMQATVPMNRLLQGDVGSGKTVVAAAGAFAAFVQGYQSVFMAPTQILAHQHFSTLSSIFEPFKVRVNLITSDEKISDIGRTDIFVGTHSLIHQKVPFDKIALVVIDEQHRFGVEQRAHLTKIVGKKHFAPHVLTMTATPIPRTIALTLYGDLDLSTLDELPSGRQKVTTWIVPPEKRDGAYNWIRDKVKNEKTQVFIVCPLIEESEVETMQAVRAVTQEFEKLKSTFPMHKLGLLHGRLKSDEKNKVLEEFKKGKIDILVSTPVVEVGIDIPNASIMLIEASERFGLAQLHQLRGRVGRGKKKSYCLLFSENKSPKILARLSAMETTSSGFALAELDLKLRGPGEVFGLRQHGFPELKIASWNDFDLIKKSKETAEEAFKNPKNFTKLFEKLKLKQKAAN